MTFPPGYRITRLDDAQHRDAVLDLERWAFPTEIEHAALAATAPPIPWGRFWAVQAESAVSVDGKAGAEFAAMFGTYTLSAYPVPGAQVDCAWLTWVGVHPGHRRRGLLRAMISQHIADARERGEAISGLAAAEAAIYGRFGYGMAAQQLSLTIPRGAALRPVAGSAELSVELHEWDAARFAAETDALHREYALRPAGVGRPGWSTWETPELRERRHEDPPVLREGAETSRVLIVRDASGAAQGYARFQRRLAWPRNIADGTVEVREAVALDPAASHRMWSVLLDLDLMARVAAGPIPVDDPIFTLLVDARAALPVTEDQQWIRILDLPRALTERRFSAPVDVVLEVTDELIPENAGRWRVNADSSGTANVTRSEAAPDIVLNVRELGAMHLGATTLTALAQAGLVEVWSPQQLAPAATAWSWPVAAGASWVF